jgi:hypothetical protein
VIYKHQLAAGNQCSLAGCLEFILYFLRRSSGRGKKKYFSSIKPDALFVNVRDDDDGKNKQFA